MQVDKNKPKVVKGNPKPEKEKKSNTSPDPQPSSEIVSAAIYPPIGVCRIGNSQDEYYIGPEVPNPLAKEPGFYRDATGAIKREAACFRIYGLDAQGNPVRELTLKEAKITWNVHLANKKSAWYQFQLALDIPEAADADASILRNDIFEDRTPLIIDAGMASISGENAKSAALTGCFVEKEVYLGELKTDGEGRLLVLGGRGNSASYDGSAATTFANNEKWHDDTSDGSVTATVEYNNTTLDVLPAWVIVAPPNYAPQQKSVRTMWDLMRDVAIQAGMLSKPKQPSFREDILPIFERMAGLQWVNAGFAAAFGFGGTFDLNSLEWIKKLADNSETYQAMRQVLANQFRVFERDSWAPSPYPWLYGDAMNVPAAQTPRQNAALTDTQLGFLQQWAKGDFMADFDPNYEPPREIEQFPPEQQADMLTKAAMEFCLADAFHPGCEMTWPMRTAGMYMAPFRLKHAPRNWVEPDYGPVLTPKTIQLPQGPLLIGQVPGGITRWMAVPWQTDTASCRSGYDKKYDPYLPTFWPARVPNQVMSPDNYQTVMDTNLSLGERLQAFAKRADWFQTLGHPKDYPGQLKFMIEHFEKMGIVEVQEGLPNDPNFPAKMEVSDVNYKSFTKKAKLMVSREMTANDAIELGEEEEETFDLSQIEKVRRFR
ncbi:MAG: LodA/GoxA family CTQ-dependent oxidase [Bacteroidia bacterium]